MTETKLTAKREAFCLKYVECGNASEAYRHAFNVGENTKPETIWTNAAKTLGDTKVLLRVTELQAEIRERTNVTVESQTRRLQILAGKAERMASESGINAAINAEKEVNKLNGLGVERKSHTVSNEMCDELRAWLGEA